MRNSAFFLACVFSFSAFCGTQIRTQAWQEHCKKNAADSELIIKKLHHKENRLSFTNHGGLFDKGVCWWHSRLTRTAQYMAAFDPMAPALSESEAYAQVKRLRNGKPTTFNGYKNLQEFSKVHYKAIQKNLEEWQISSGGFQLGFLDGIRGSTSVPAAELKTLMDTTYGEFSKNRKPIYQVLQLPGVMAHSWLLIDMQPTVDGYEFEVVDSNFLGNQYWSYKNGDTNLFYGDAPFVNYTTYRGKIEEGVLSRRLKETCSNLMKRRNMSDPVLSLDEEVDSIIQMPLQY
jgi:hypothetical protein